MRVTLTPELVRKAKPGPQRVFFWDALVPGLGLVVHPSGRKGYVYQETGNGRRRQNLEAPSLAQARKAVLALSTGLVEPEAATAAEPEPPPHPPAALTMNSLLDGWLIALSERPSPPRSLPRIRAVLDNHVRPRIGKIEFSHLTRLHVLAIPDALSARGLRGMANQCIAYVRAALRWAEDSRLIEEAPRWRLPRQRLGTRAHALAPDEWARMMRVLRDPANGLHEVARRALLAIALTGCRKGEIAGLRWDAIAPDGSLVLVRHKSSMRSGPKRVPGSAALTAVLTDMKECGRRLTEAQPTTRLQAALRDSPFVFPSIARNAMGQPIQRILDDTWAEVRSLAGLPPTMTIHGLRGAFITQAQRLGVPLGTVAAMVGHENAQTTLRHYTVPTASEVAEDARRVADWIAMMR